MLKKKNIFLEAKSQQEVQDMDEDRIQEWKGGGGHLDESQIITQSPRRENSVPHMANVGKVKFQPPNVPVIFVLGGPGSGKVTHCDTLMQEKRGLTHINMMDLLQQYAMGNGKRHVKNYSFIDFRYSLAEIRQ
jgi:hypothetical protein